MYTEFDKAIVAFVMASIALAQWFVEFDFAGYVSADMVTSLVALATPLMVYIVPNKKKAAEAVAAPVAAPPAA